MSIITLNALNQDNCKVYHPPAHRKTGIQKSEKSIKIKISPKQ
jgi:hypothetical protein